jgi:hypothetical protein
LLAKKPANARYFDVLEAASLGGLLHTIIILYKKNNINIWFFVGTERENKIDAEQNNTHRT